MKRFLGVLMLAALFLSCFVPFSAWAEGTAEETATAGAGTAQAEIVAIRCDQNVGAYKKATPESRFVGWAKMGRHYEVLETVKGNRQKTWLRIRLEDGTEGYIPEYTTSPVVKDAEENALTHIMVFRKSFVNVRRAPDCDSVPVGTAKRLSVYPVIGEQVRGWWPVALENGTTGYVHDDSVWEIDPAEAAKERHVVFHGRSLIYAEPDGDSPVLTGIGPDAALRCVLVIPQPSYEKKAGIPGYDWYQVETMAGGYGFVSSKNAELADGPLQN